MNRFAFEQQTANRKPKGTPLSYEAAKSARLVLDWDNYLPPIPITLGVQVLDDYPLEALVDTIDWTPFFITWGLTGKYPKIFSDKKVGDAAKNLFDEAQQMLKKLIHEKQLTAQAVFGLWPANTVNFDDIEIYSDDSRCNIVTTLHQIRQQVRKPGASREMKSLADFIAPKETKVKDYIGGFAVTAGLGAQQLAEEYIAKGDDYNSIMVKALADRLAEAFAEHLHMRVRKEFWGYAHDEALDNDAMISEKYQGIRPAPGYPCCPDHTEKEHLFSLLDANNNSGISLTESFAMMPAASVSGWYFSHPQAKYFNTGKMRRDQLESLAVRKGMETDELQHWLSSIMADA